MPAGRGEVVAMERGAGLIVNAKLLVAACDKVSPTRTVKFAVPAVVGVPLIIPTGESASPAGKLPDETDHM